MLEDKKSQNFFLKFFKFYINYVIMLDLRVN